MNENNSKYKKRDNDNAGRSTKPKSKKNYSEKRKYHRKKKRECPVNNKTDLQVQNFADKNNLQDTELFTKIISLNATTSN